MTVFSNLISCIYCIKPSWLKLGYINKFIPVTKSYTFCECYNITVNLIDLSVIYIFSNVNKEMSYVTKAVFIL